MAQQDNPYLTITLTGRAPAKIKKADWPVLASAEENDRHGTQIGNNPTIEENWALKVRQNDDGRAIVYAIYSYDTAWQGEMGLSLRGGELLDGGADLPAAIARVAQSIEDRVPEEISERPSSKGIFSRLAHECIADLPAVEI
jgi:hypothetical protein